LNIRTVKSLAHLLKKCFFVKIFSIISFIAPLTQSKIPTSFDEGYIEIGLKKKLKESR